MANTIKIKNSGTASAVPASLEHGELGLNYADGKLYFKNSSNTIVDYGTIVAAGGGASVVVSDTAPSSPGVGDIWYESDTGKVFVYYDSFWVEASNGGSVGPAGPAGLLYQSFTVPSTLNTGTGKARFYASAGYTVTNVAVSVGTAPTGSSVIVDVLKNGSTIFTTTANRPTITAGNFQDASSIPNSSESAIISGDYLTISILQIGSTIAGSDLTVQITLQPT
jgi:hypothetical protein